MKEVVTKVIDTLTQEEIVHTIIREELKMRKICVKFVPRVLREDQKERRCHDQDGHQDSSSPSL